MLLAYSCEHSLLFCGNSDYILFDGDLLRQIITLYKNHPSSTNHLFQTNCTKMAKKRNKPKSMKSPVVNKQSTNEEIIVASSPIPVSAKVCRLCETKEGPFLNIFVGEKNTAKKIELLMPFGVAENDELPHKICFRCSAKVEELHEFVQKCIKTQENLYNSLGKKCPSSKVKTHRSLWEEKLNRSNITNDDICDAVIKKAMEGIKSTELKEIKEKSVVKISKVSASETLTTQSENNAEKEEPDMKKRVSQVNELTNKTNIANKDLFQCAYKLSLDKCDDKASTKTRSLRSGNDVSLFEGIPTKTPKGIQTAKPKNATKPLKVAANKIEESSSFQNTDASLNTNADKKKSSEQVTNTNDISMAQRNSIEKKVEKPFNIMDHVSMIKVNGVGVLFQCKLCNRNFLKKDVVLSHWCAKNGVAKEDFIKRAAPPEPPRISTVKYINTKTDDSKKQRLDNKSDQIENKKNSKGEETEVKKAVIAKPKIGPASKVKRISDDSSISASAPVAPIEPTPLPGKSGTVLPCPVVPSLNCRYKLVPGPNNTFTLVEAHSTDQHEETVNKEYVAKKKKSSSEDFRNESSSKQRKVLRSQNAFYDKDGTVIKPSTEVIELTDCSEKESANQPYPVGLFQTVSRHSNNEEPAAPTVVPFATSAQKKQSYTIVQTGNPSKLLISAKPQPQNMEPPKKKHKKVKPAAQNVTPVKEPFSVTLEDATHPKDSGFFTFINLDPLLQPSYVLPTDNSIVQESQISMSSTQPKKTQNLDKNEKYTCNMCSEVFTREQKLLVHINSHYNKMDEEDQMRAEKPSRKRGKKSYV